MESVVIGVWIQGSDVDLEVGIQVEIVWEF